MNSFSNKTIEALHKALKVLNCLNNDRVYETAWVKGAINACEEALEQPAQEYLTRAQQVIRANNSAQEPVAWIKEIELGYMKSNIEIGKMDYRTNLGLKPEPDDIPLYTHPAPSWQGLSDDEIFELHHKWIINSGNKDTQYDFARAIEQALKEKNGC